jgi:hypothetical protein
MKNENKIDSKALVTVLHDLETAQAIVEKLHEEGFPLEKIELVTHDVHEEAPQIDTPHVTETTATNLVESAAKGAGLGAAAGLLAAVFAPFPGVGLAMIAMGGLVGGAFGGVAGVAHAAEDETVDLPKVSEYEQLVKDGHSLVVVLGTHDEVHRASEIVEGMSYIHNHIYRVHGHDSHEHPAREE